jgi:hypothetical protein
MSEDIVDELNFYAQRAEADEKVLSLLAEAAGTIQRLRAPMSPGDMFNGLVRSLNYDGPDTASLTLGEIARAVDGATLTRC